MRLRNLALVAAAAAAAGGCGGDAADEFPLDVKGTPFLVVHAGTPQAAEEAAPHASDAPSRTAPALESLGDIDAGPATPPLPPIVTPPAPVAAPPEAAPAPSPAAKAALSADDETPTSFDDLAAFECTSFGSSERRAIPANVLALSGKKVVLDGYVMPIQYEAGGAKKFLLMRYRFGCCYAVTPQLNEWIEVTMEKGVAEYIPDAITTVTGVLLVKEDLKEGAVIGLYTMRAVRAEITEAR